MTPAAVVPGLLEGSVAIVTGAGKGIGRGIALEIARAQGGVILVGRSMPDLESVADEIRAIGAEAAPIAADLRVPESLERMLVSAEARFSRIDVLVNNAGVIILDKFWDYDEDTYRTIMDTNLTGTFLLSQMMARRWIRDAIPGRIVTIASVESEIAYPDQAPYAATKGGLLTMTKVLAQELGEHGIRVNAIGPGPIETPISEPFRALSEARVVFHRLGEPSEVGQAVVFLASEMASFVTGTILYVDGGYMLSR